MFGFEILTQALLNKKNSPISEHPEYPIDKLPDEARRVADALMIQEAPREVSVDNLDQIPPKQLAKAVYSVNGAAFHYSGNCALLQAVFMYNMVNPHGVILSGTNTSEPMRAVNSGMAQFLITGGPLEPVKGGDIHDIDQLEEKILEHYKASGQRVFAIDAEGYQVPLMGESAHGFNAVVRLDSSGEPHVQFIDAWKTSNSLPTKDDLRAKYSDSATFKISFCKSPGKMPNFAGNLKHHTLQQEASDPLLGTSDMPGVGPRRGPANLGIQGEMKRKLSALNEQGVEALNEQGEEEDVFYDCSEEPDALSNPASSSAP